MLVELCVGDYATFDGLMNEVDDIFKASTTYSKKTMIWIMFQNWNINKRKNNNNIVMTFLVQECYGSPKNP
jgi:hypothetical protein